MLSAHRGPGAVPASLFCARLHWSLIKIHSAPISQMRRLSPFPKAMRQTQGGARFKIWLQMHKTLFLPLSWYTHTETLTPSSRRVLRAAPHISAPTHAMGHWSWAGRSSGHLSQDSKATGQEFPHSRASYPW